MAGNAYVGVVWTRNLCWRAQRARCSVSDFDESEVPAHAVAYCRARTIRICVLYAGAWNIDPGFGMERALDA